MLLLTKKVICRSMFPFGRPQVVGRAYIREIGACEDGKEPLFFGRQSIVNHKTRFALLAN